MSVNIDQIADSLIKSKHTSYKSDYVFHLEEKLWFDKELNILTLSKNNEQIGIFYFFPKHRIFTNDGTYEYPNNGIGGFANINPYNSGPALEVKHEYQGKHYGLALLSIGIKISQKKCKDKSNKPHYFVVSEIEPKKIDFFEKYGFQMDIGRINMGEMNTDTVKIPELRLKKSFSEYLRSFI